jgi:hypothetical protein
METGALAHAHLVTRHETGIGGKTELEEASPATATWPPPTPSRSGEGCRHRWRLEARINYAGGGKIAPTVFTNRRKKPPGLENP